GHSRPHHDTSTEFHTESGPFTLVPLPRRRSSLVFVVDPAEVAKVSMLSDAQLAAEVERRSHSILGKIEVEAPRRVSPLMVETAARFGAGRVALIGEAAHVIAPIGAQGLNLGLRDAATIGELVVAAHRDGHDVGEVTDRYDRMRRADATSRMLAVDLLNRSLLSDFLPLQSARAAGLFLMNVSLRCVGRSCARVSRRGPPSRGSCAERRCRATISARARSRTALAPRIRNSTDAPG